MKILWELSAGSRSEDFVFDLFCNGSFNLWGYHIFVLYISLIKPGDEKDRNNTSQWNTIQIKLLIINNVFSIYSAPPT